MRRGLLLAAVALCACSRASSDALVLKHQPLWGDPAPFHALLDGFRKANPGVELRTETLPNGSDIAREMFVTALEGGADDFDVFAIDVVWVAEFARAGWLADLSGEFPRARLRAELLPGPAEAVILEGRTYAVPWFVDVGVLYRRTDLVPDAPGTFDALEKQARAVMRPGLAGYLWQGRQSEGLACNYFEAVSAFGGFNPAKLDLSTPAALQGLQFLRGTIESGLSPRSVTSSAEEETRRAFQDGRAVFLRNWPYAWAEFQSAGSPVRGKVGFSAVPGGAGTLGGWQLAVNARSRHRPEAAKLVAWLTSPEAAAMMAVDYSRIPARRAVYDDAQVRAKAPFIAALLPLSLAARPRPVSPYYLLAGDSLQGELSAAISGIRTPEEALQRAAQTVQRLEASR